MIRTNCGLFRVLINDDILIDYKTREQTIIGKIITVGGKNTCVAIKAPISSSVAHLLNVKRIGGGCELEGKELSGKKTVGMINLAFTILKETMPEIEKVTLEDRSDFPCTFKNGSIAGISLASHQMMFHQKSWYERYFHARLINPDIQGIYEKSKANFKTKPKYFDFNHPDLNSILGPILAESLSWEDFFKKIYKMENICEIIYLWYSRALKEIFENVSFDRQDWIIDLKDIDMVGYTRVYTGGTRKKISYVDSPSIPYSDEMSYDEKMKYKFNLLGIKNGIPRIDISHS